MPHFGTSPLQLDRLAPESVPGEEGLPAVLSWVTRISRSEWWTLRTEEPTNYLLRDVNALAWIDGTP